MQGTHTPSFWGSTLLPDKSSCREAVLSSKCRRYCGLRARSLPEHNAHEDAKRSPKLPFQVLLDEAPRIRVRNLSDRQMEQLGELVVANERLAGRPGSKARQRVEFLKRRREVWEQIYYHLTKEEATATLLTLEEANKQVAAAMSEQWRETQSVSALKKQLVVLQSKVSEAHNRLHYTQDLVQLNMNRIQQQAGPEAAHSTVGADSSLHPPPALETSPGQAQASPPVVDSRVVPIQEPEAASRWVPVAFSESVGEGMSVFQHAGQPWVLFRDAEGQVACIEDCCAHRACPLSLGKVVGGQPMCAYHGWKYNSTGECTEMPSTMMCPGIRVNHMACAEADGVLWVAAADAALSQLPPRNTAAAMVGMTVVARVQTHVKLGSREVEQHLLQTGPIISCWDPQPRKLSGSWAQAGAAALLGLGGEGAAEMTQPGWITCSQGDSIREVHTLTESKPGECRWLYQLSIPSHHWSRGAIPKHFWHQLAEKAMATQRTMLEPAETGGSDPTAAI